jgi:uncharacterized protein (TIGR02391 family)
MDRSNRKRMRKIPLDKETWELTKLRVYHSHILQEYIFPHFRDHSEYDIIRSMVELMEDTGISKQIIYAFIKTGRVLTEMDLKFVSSEDKKAWRKAIRQYNQLIKSGALSPSDSLIPFIKASKRVPNPKKNQAELEHLFDARNFHHSIVEVSRKQFLSYDFPDAVFNAYRKVLNTVKEKSGNTKEDGIALVTSVFNPKHPLLQTPLVNVIGDVSIQEGIMHLFMGAVLSIRNIFAHKDVYLTDTDATLEYLSFASFLCKILDIMQKQSKQPPY